MYLLIFVRLQAERRISFVKGSLAFMTGVHSKVATIMKETGSGTRCGRRTMYVSCRFIASGSISVMRYNNNNNQPPAQGPQPAQPTTHQTQPTPQNPQAVQPRQPHPQPTAQRRQ